MSDNSKPDFLSGGGEMGDRIRSYDWSKTAVGPIDSWSQSLRTTLSIILHSKFPMFLYWGKDLIQFYNDPYRFTLGNNGKHPTALGQKARECWPDIWHLIGPVIEQVMEGGEANWTENQRFTVTRNDKTEEVYWTYSYSPVTDENENVAGVFVTCTETTKEIRSIKRLEESEDPLRFAIDAAALGTWDYDPLSNKFTANDRLKEWFGLAPESEIELTRAIATIAGSDKERVAAAIQKSLRYDSGGFYDIEYTILHPQTKKERVVRAMGRAWFNDEKIAYRFNGTLQAVTEAATARRKTESRELRLRNLIKDATYATAILEGREKIITLANDAALNLWGRDDSVIGKPVLEAIPELLGQGFADRLEEVYDTGNTLSEQSASTLFSRNGKLEQVFVDYVYKPMLNNETGVMGILVTGVDVTDKILARKSAEESEQQIRSFVENAPFPIGVYVGREMRIQLANQAIMDTFGKGNDVIGKLYTDILPELKNQEIFEQIIKVFDTGIPYHAKNQRVDLVIDDLLQSYYFNYSFTPLRDSKGNVYAVMNTAADVTDLNLAKSKIEESEQRFRTMVQQAPIAIGLTRGADMVFESINSPMLQLIGKTGDVIGKPLLSVLPELSGQKIFEIIQEAYISGKPFQGYEIPASLLTGEMIEERYFNVAYTPLQDDGVTTAILHVATDVTVQVKNREKMEAAELLIRNTAERLEMALEAGDLGSYEMTISTGKIYSTPGYLANFGLQPDVMFDLEKLVSVILPEDRIAMESAMKASIEEKKIHKAEYRIHWPDGTVRWIRTAGKPVYNEDGTPLKMVGITIDITEQKLFSEELTKQVKERTMELQRSNEDLMQFAHVISHDLREPVRKIKIFTSRISDEYGNLLPPTGAVFLDKVQHSSNRMLDMIDGVLVYSTVTSTAETIEKVDLNKIVSDIETDLEIIIYQKNAVLTKKQLPVFDGASILIYQLFYNIINNALKFLKTDEPGRIVVSSEQFKSKGANFVRIIVADNGIGFDAEYRDKIFNTFTRLNSKDRYEGTGLGLALCKKIVERHGGTISADGVRNQGASFTVTLPLVQKQKRI
jgi:PAS domain S-box-containing protein